MDTTITANFLVKRAIAMADDHGVSEVDMIDRLLTYGAFGAVKQMGKADAGEFFRDLAAKVERGYFDMKVGTPPGTSH